MPEAEATGDAARADDNLAAEAETVEEAPAAPEEASVSYSTSTPRS